MTTTYKLQFAPRFRRNIFGWKSQPAILRIKEALSEIKLVAKRESALAAEGALVLGEAGAGRRSAIKTLVSITAKVYSRAFGQPILKGKQA